MTATQERPRTLRPPVRLPARYFRSKTLARTAFFLTLCALFAAAALHSKTPFYTAGLLYVLAAGWWVFEDQRCPSGGRLARLLAVSALVLAAVAAVARVLGYDDGVFLAVVLGYLGTGTLISEARSSITRDHRHDQDLEHGHEHHAARCLRGWRRWTEPVRQWLRSHLAVLGRVLTLGCAVLAVVGWELLDTRSGLALGLLVTAAATSSVAVGLLSEDLLRTLTARSDERGVRALLTLAVGSVLALVALGVLLQQMEPETLLVLGLVVGLLVLGVASNTQTDIVLIVAVTASVLYLTADDVEDTRQHTLPGDDPAVVVLGDSYISGEGARAYFAGTDDAGRNECRRARTSYAGVLADSDPRVPRLAFVACSGAVAENLYRRAQYPGEPRPALLPPDGGQEGARGLDQLAHLAALRERADFDVRLVLLSIGGNDSGFSTIGTTCLAPGDCSALEPVWTSALGHVRRQVGVAYDEVRRALPGVPVVVVPYPLPLSDRDRCPSVWLDRSERDFLTGFTLELNATLRREAARAGFWFVEEMQDSLQGQRLCDGRPRRLGINFIGLRSVSGLPTQSLDPANWAHNSLHPNERGHEAMARTLARWLDAHPDLTAGPPTGPGRLLTADERAAADRPDPGAQCDVTDRGPEGCRSVAERWALAEVEASGPALAVPLLGLVGLWAMSLGVLALGRRARARRPGPAHSAPPS